jgi:N-methylhydantoinase B
MNSAFEIEILRSKFDAVAIDMARVIERTSFTTFAKETADFCCGLIAPSGEFFAYPWSIGATSLLGLNLTVTLGRLSDPQPGDVFITNDPFLGGPICTHLPDINVLRPIFADGELLCWAYGLIHSTDVGGAVPGSVWSQAFEVYQEGLRIRPVRLWKGDDLNQDVADLILDNTRIPRLNWGDLNALYASLRTGDEAVGALVAKHGRQFIASGIEGVLDYAEAEARSVFRGLPSGRFEFTDYLEDDRVSSVPVRIKVCLEVRDGEVTIDFSGTDPQVRSSINIVTGDVTHPFLCQALIAYLVTHNPEVPKCSSILRPIKVVAPEGIVVNAVYPAATGARYATSLRVSDVVLGALAKACPGEVPAGGSGMLAPVAASVPDPATGAQAVQVVEPLIGGGGGRPASDGLDGVESVFAGYLRNTPVEVIEQELQVRIKRYALARDTGGAGQYRGGLAVCLSIEALRPDTLIVARGLERFILEPWGLQGGDCGTPGSCVVWRTDGSTQDVGTKGEALLQPGDVIEFVSPAGGGYGPPLARRPESVASDVRNGVLSAGRALADYAVVVDSEGVLCAEATATQRAARSAGADAEPGFAFGPRRRALEQAWPPALQDMCQSAGESLPVGVRDWLKHRLYEHWSQRPPQQDPATDSEYREALARIEGLIQHA